MVGRLGSHQCSVRSAAERARGSLESRSPLRWQMSQEGSNGDGESCLFLGVCVFLMIRNAKLLFICMSSLEKCWFRSTQFFFAVELHELNVLYTFGIFAKIFSHSLGCLFLLWMVSLLCRMLSILYMTPFCPSSVCGRLLIST